MQSVFGDADGPIVVELAQEPDLHGVPEVGRVMRTVVLLRFLAHSGLRGRVTAATNAAATWPDHPGGVSAILVAWTTCPECRDRRWMG